METELSWRQVPNWSNIDWQCYSLVSFDIFDTLLHRSLATPKSLFIELGQLAAARGLVDGTLSPAEFAQLRVDIELQARKESTGESSEVTLDQIWQQAPSELPTEEILSLELDLEYSHSFVNPYTRDLLCYLLKQGIQVYLTSDTYFPRWFIERLLRKAGLDPDGVNILLSCEQDANKSSGALFKRLLELKPVPANRILHIGDDLTADYLQGQKAGLAVCYVGDIHLPASLYQGDMLLGLDHVQDPLRSLRRLGHFVSPERNESAAFFRYLGASVLGPGLAVFALWTVLDAQARGIRLICPIMREGGLLAPLLRSACKLVDAKMDVRPLFTSRRAAFLPAMGELDETALKQFAERRHFTLSDLITELNLPDVPEGMRAQLGLTLNEVLSREEWRQYLQSDEVKAAARNSSLASRQLLREYVDTLWHEHGPVALMDLGPGGNSLAWLADSIGDLADRISINYLFYGIPELSKHRRRGHRYAVFLPNTPESLPVLRLFNRSPEPIEVLLTGRYQTTLGYGRDTEGNVAPLLGEVFKASEQESLLGAFAEGVVLAWRHLAHLFPLVENERLTGRESRYSVLKQIQRLLELPTPLEAERLGDLQFDDNAGSLSYSRICSDEDHLRLVQWGPEEFMRQSRQLWGYKTHNIRWPQAVVSRVYPDFLCAQYRALFNDVEHRLLCVTLLEQVKSDSHTRATLYGGGKLGYEMLQEAGNRGIHVDWVVDSNATLHGLSLMDREIVSLRQAVEKGCGIFLVASAAFAQPIEQGILDYYDSRGLPPPPIYAIHRRKH
ncbi:hypothetical protein GCM10011352_37290 [Marinobacterium zhoushanense]|uniref:HAD superfamily hydrolase (TIGR01549 family) n=1 Tax=Marinobacterium zhoushanense TaxID=1679163 RepID=A0ABQ1KQH8_9GAMM|nr:HAD family hydrolase [Marinobacterium zhoushanense]GGC07580.1 hypothetical protein GCM10011352_37290 [Marinobacterium zhoushanense]